MDQQIVQIKQPMEQMLDLIQAVEQTLDPVPAIVREQTQILMSHQTTIQVRQSQILQIMDHQIV